MNMKPVEGSNAITHEAYDSQTRTLYLRFAKSVDKVHEVQDVDPATYREFLASKSKGKFFHSHLK